MNEGKKMPKTKEVYSAYITLRNGKRLYARHYGLEAFRFEVKVKDEPVIEEEKNQE